MPTSPSTCDAEANWTNRDRAVLSTIERSLADGVALKRWWERYDRMGDYAERFELTRSFNRSATSYGFFDEASLIKCRYCRAMRTRS